MRLVTGYLSFASAHPRPLGSAASLTWLSGFGQTFFVALTGGAIATIFALSDGALGTAYAAATLASGFLLGPVGRLIDRVSMPRYLGVATLLLAGAVLPYAGWRWIWFGSAAIVLFAGTAAVIAAPLPAHSTIGRDATHAPRGRSLWRDGRFLAAIPAVLAPSFVMTGFFFHQVRLAEERGWSLSVVAAGFVAFAAVRAAAMLFVGPVIDRIGSLRLLPWFLAPLGLAMVVIIAWAGSNIAPLLYLAATALTAGAATTLITSVWTEMYGPARIASVRASVAGAGVIASALAPTIFGVLIDGGVSLAAIAAGCLTYLVAASLLTRRVRR